MKITIEFESLAEMLAHVRIPDDPSADEEGSIEPAEPDIRPAVKPDIKLEDTIRHPTYGGQIWSGDLGKPATEVPPPAPEKAFQSDPPRAVAPETPVSNPYAASAAAVTDGAQSRPGVVTSAPASTVEPPKPDAGAAAEFGAPPPADEDYRRTVRAKLREINHMAGVNIAKGIIQQVAGVTRLPDVPLDKLETVMAAARAKEAELKSSAAQ